MSEDQRLDALRRARCPTSFDHPVLARCQQAEIRNLGDRLPGKPPTAVRCGACPHVAGPPGSALPPTCGGGGEPVQRGDQEVDLAAGVVHGKRRPDGRLQPVAAQDRLGAVVAGADRDAVLVQR